MVSSRFIPHLMLIIIIAISALAVPSVMRTPLSGVLRSGEGARNNTSMNLSDLDRYSLYVWNVSSILDRKDVLDRIVGVIVGRGEGGFDDIVGKCSCKMVRYRREAVEEEYMVCKTANTVLAIGEYGHVIFNVYDGFSLPFQSIADERIGTVESVYRDLVGSDLNISIRYLGQEYGGISIVRAIGNTTSKPPIPEGVYKLDPMDLYGIYIDGVLLSPVIVVRGIAGGSWSIDGLNFSVQYLRGFFPLLTGHRPIKYNVSREVYRVAAEYWMRTYGEELDPGRLLVLELTYVFEPLRRQIIPRLRIGVNGTNRVLGIDLYPGEPEFVVEEVIGGIIGAGAAEASYDTMYPDVESIENSSEKGDNSGSHFTGTEASPQAPIHVLEYIALAITGILALYILLRRVKHR